MWFDILKWEEILKRKIFEGEVPKWLEEYADMKDSDSVEIEGFTVYGHAMKRMMGWDESNEPRKLDGGFYFFNMLKALKERIKMRRKFFNSLRQNEQFSVTANNYVWAVEKKSNRKYAIVSYIGTIENIKGKKKSFEIGIVDSDGFELARSRKELLAERIIEKPSAVKTYDASKVKDIIMNDPSLKHYEVDLDELVNRLTSFDSYDDIIGALNQAIEDESRDRIKIPLRKIRNLISEINKAETLYTEDTLKTAGGVSAYIGGKRNAPIIGNPKYGGKKHDYEREEEH